MRAERLLGAGKGVRLSVLEMIRLSHEGLGVAEIARRLGMSYMGIKAHCLTLEAEGFLTTWREASVPGSKGRPRLLYRLSPSGKSLFEPPVQSLALALLDQAATLQGVPFAQKLLLLHHRNEASRYGAAVSGTTPRERAISFARIRSEEGWMSCFEESARGVSLSESRDPEAGLLTAWPIVATFREQMVSEVIGTAVKLSLEGMIARYRF